MRRVATISGVVWLEMIRRKDVYVRLILLLALLFVLMSLNVFGLGAVVGYVADIGLLFAWLFSVILCVSLTSRQLPQEEARGTIYPLLAKPITRGELVVGKWLGAWSASAACTLLFYGVILAVLLLRGGSLNPACLAQAVLLHLVALAIVGGCALLCSTRMTYGAAASVAYVVLGACFAVVPRVPELLMHESGLAGNGLLAIYYALPHLELFDIRQRLIHDWGPAPWGVVGGVVLYGLLWTAIFILLSWMAYRGKRFKRGAMPA